MCVYIYVGIYTYVYICVLNKYIYIYVCMYIYRHITAIAWILPASPAWQEMAGLVKDHPEFPGRAVRALGSN